MSEVDTEDRSGFIGASEVAEALGLSPYNERNPVRLAMEKLGRIPRAAIDPNLAKWGKLMQPVILRAAEDRMGVRIRETDDPRGHKTIPFLRCRTDGVTDRGIIIEAKNYSESRARQYPNENEPEELPLYDLAQVAAEMACWDAEVAYLAILFGGRDFRMYRIDRDPDFENSMLEKLGVFWTYIQRNQLPPATNGADAALLYPRHDDGMVRIASPVARERVVRLSELKRAVKTINEEIETHEDRLKADMGAAGQLLSADGQPLATWKASADVSSFDTKRFRADHPQIYDQYTVYRPGARRLLLKI